MVGENKFQNFKKIVIDEIGPIDGFEKEVDEYLEAFLKIKTDDEMKDLYKAHNIELELLELAKAKNSNPELASLTEEQKFLYGIKLGKLFYEMKRKNLPTLAMLERS